MLGLPKDPTSPYPRSSARMMMMFGGRCARVVATPDTITRTIARVIHRRVREPSMRSSSCLNPSSSDGHARAPWLAQPEHDPESTAQHGQDGENEHEVNRPQLSQDDDAARSGRGNGSH